MAAVPPGPRWLLSPELVVPNFPLLLLPAASPSPSQLPVLGEATTNLWAQESGRSKAGA